MSFLTNRRAVRIFPHEHDRIEVMNVLNTEPVSQDSPPEEKTA
jgi:hypothetical protein